MPEKSKPDTKKTDPAENDRKHNEGEPSYYYDDAHGYKDFDPNEDDEEIDD